MLSLGNIIHSSKIRWVSVTLQREMREHAISKGIPVVKAWTPEEMGIDPKAASTGDFKKFYQEIQVEKTLY